MFFANLFDLSWFAIALAHILAVVAYANWKSWGEMSWSAEDRRFRSPGGVIALSLPVDALIVYFIAAVVAFPNEASSLVGMLALHFIRVRILLFVLFGLPALWTRWTTGELQVFCMDKRLDYLVGVEKGNLVGLHNGTCGAFVTLTMSGTMPLLLIVAFVMLFRVDIPIWVVWIAAVPYLFLFGKHWHYINSNIPDSLEVITEYVGAKLASVYMGADLRLQIVKSHDHTHAH